MIKRGERPCKEIGITVIDVPYWWDKKKESLMATIKMKRPDLIQEDTSKFDPIPEIKPMTLAKTNLATCDPVS